jgi:transposase-like protein
LDSSKAGDTAEKISAATVVIAFTNTAAKFVFLDSLAEQCLRLAKQGIHVRATANSLIPSKVTAYRWSSLTWDRLEEVFSK